MNETYIVSPRWQFSNRRIEVVGCGGTGSFVAEGLCRLLIGNGTPIILIDHDKVERHNLLRQNFYQEDLGRFKSQALAERLSLQFPGQKVGYSVSPFIPNAKIGHGSHIYSSWHTYLIIGCVDNANARRDMNAALQDGCWWIDSGNGFQSGQVLIGCRTDYHPRMKNEYMGWNNSFDRKTMEAYRLPSPALQLPSLLAPETVPAPDVDCAQAVIREEQSPTINRVMADLVLDFVAKLLSHKLTSMGAYIDLETGRLSYIPATPETVARLVSVPVDTLFEEKETKKERRT